MIDLAIPTLIVFSFLCLCIPEKFARLISFAVGLFAIAIFVESLKILPIITSASFVLINGPTLFSALHLTLSYRIDALSLIFILLISGIGALIFLYAFFYLNHTKRQKQFFFALTLFMAAMLGIVSADNLLLLFIFWELTTLSSYLLIAYHHKEESSRYAALQALLVTFTGGLCLLVAIILIGALTNDLSITNLLANSSLLLNSKESSAILLLIFLAAFTKSAQFPFHFWLPGAMKAPTPVSAYLHSATMVNAGIYLLARLHPIYADNPFWYPTLTAVGLLTMFAGALLCFKEKDLKLILAYTTVFALGSMTYLLAGETPLTLLAFGTLVIAHALYKASLFMLVGAIDKRYGTRDLNQIRGLFRLAPFMSIAYVISVLSMAGAPLLFGFISKQLIFEVKFAKTHLSIPLEILSILPSMLISTQSLRIMIPVLSGPVPHTAKRHYQSLSFGPIILALLSLILGLFPNLLDQTQLMNQLVQALSLPADQAHLLARYQIASYSGLLSLLVLGGGIFLYCFNRPLTRWLSRYDIFERLGPAALFNKALTNFPLFANRISHFMQNGDIRFYMALIWLFMFTLVGIGLTTLIISKPSLHLAFQTIYPGDIMIALVVLASAFAVIPLGSTIGSLLALGVFGIGMALVFIIHGAPDVAMTQILVELLLVIFFVINLYRLPILKSHKTNSLSANVIAACFGIGVFIVITLLTLYVLSSPPPNTLNEYYINNSLEAAHGLNVVNAIIVDFRALDTLGEILVITASAIGVFGLIMRKRLKEK